MKILITLVAAIVIAFPAIANEEEIEVTESEFGDFGRILESILGSVAHELGDVASRIEPDKALDRTLSLTIEVDGHDPVSILCATTRFSLESEHQDSSVENEATGSQGKEQSSLLELSGAISTTEEDEVYLIRYSGSFIFDASVIDNTEGGGREKNEAGRLEFEGSAQFSIGSERILTQKGDRHVLLSVEEAE